MDIASYECFFQYLVIFFYCAARNTTILSYVCIIDKFTIGKSGFGQKSRKNFSISNKFLDNVNLSNSLDAHKLRNLWRLEPQICAYIIQFDLSHNKILSEDENIVSLISTIK